MGEQESVVSKFVRGGVDSYVDNCCVCERDEA